MAGLHGRLAWCLALLTAFFLVRTLGGHARPAAQSNECEHQTVADLTAMEGCLRVRPSDVELMADLGEAYEQAGRWDRAESLYRQALAVDIDDGDMHVRLGHVLLRRGDMAGARHEAEIAVALQPGRRGPVDLLHQSAIGRQPGPER